MWRPLGIVGAGAVATALGVLLKRAGAHVDVLAGRNPDRIRAASERIGCEGVSGAAEAARRASWLLLVVPDDSVPEVAAEIAGVWRQRLPECAAACHVSGALGMSALAEVEALGAGVGAAHPLQSVVDVDAALEFLPRSTFGVSGRGEGLRMARMVARAAGGRILELEDEARALYHAAATVASNYFTVLTHVAAGLMSNTTGLSEEDCIEALLPLIQGTLQNVHRRGPVQALTGPVARGDAGTVARHLEAMREWQVPVAWEGIYRTLGVEALALARARGLSEAQARAVAEALGNGRQEEEREPSA
ncbi:MAG: DUF2520 domain-containing protein [Armatimonadetes bacterium]|nr:DUF2520 domain-containing protein [Armatimonadota bacterium]